MLALVLFLALLTAVSVEAQEPAGKAFDPFALSRLARISDPQLSPDGTRVAFVVERVRLSSNDKEKQIYLVDVSGGEPRQLTVAGDANERPRWSPDSSRIFFVSRRSGSPQIWSMGAEGGDERQVTRLATGAEGVIASRAGDRIVFTSRVFPTCNGDEACNERELARTERRPLEARIYESLLYRHWDEWDDGRRSHLFSLALGDPDARPIDLTPGGSDAPPFSLGGPDAYDISPDGQEVVFGRIEADLPALSTNSDLYVTPIAGGTPRKITENPAADTSPRYSPDGTAIAYRAQVREGYESDRFRLRIFDRETGFHRPLTEGLDRWVTSLTWSPDSQRLFFTAEDRGREPVFTIAREGGAAKLAVYGNAHHSDVNVAPDGLSVVYLADSASSPAEIYRGFAAGGQPSQVTRMNEGLLSEYELNPLEEVEYETADGRTVAGFLLKPPHFELDRRYPLLTLIHGGPQGSWSQAWSYRWNAQVFAGAGYVVFLPNPRGSTGYGQQFIDEIRYDWGGKAVDDVLAGVDHLIARPYVDASRLVAAGGSYGGYMVNWLLGTTKRFRALVSHAGIFDLRSFFGATEELWFPLWEFGGPPWQNRATYDRWSPSLHVEEFETPTLVIHGEKDYRVPVTQGMQLFTALQMRGVPSRFLYFPDEGHWILKPRNSLLWYETVLAWLDQWIKPAGAVTSPAAASAAQ